MIKAEFFAPGASSSEIIGSGLICNANCQFAMNGWYSTRTQTNSLRYSNQTRALPNHWSVGSALLELIGFSYMTQVRYGPMPYLW